MAIRPCSLKSNISGLLENKLGFAAFEGVGVCFVVVVCFLFFWLSLFKNYNFSCSFLFLRMLAF